MVTPNSCPKKPAPTSPRSTSRPRGNIPLGTDSQGKDIWAQIVHGGRDILTMALLTGVIATFIGVTLGSVSAVIGGRLDASLTMLADIWLTIPRFPLLAVVAALDQSGQPPDAGAAAVLSFRGRVCIGPSAPRSSRIKERDYIEAATALDLGLRHIIFSEVLPNMMSYIAISFTLAMTSPFTPKSASSSWGWCR